MHLLDGKPVFSATDLVAFLACGHLTDLERAVLDGLVERPHQDDAELDTIRRRGEKHEQRFLADLVAAASDAQLTVTTINPDAYLDAPDGSRDGYGAKLRSQVEQTLVAMKRGDHVIYQAAFFDGRWRGHADFLRRVDGPGAGSDLGAYHYEVIDTKLAHKAKAGALIQMCSYVDLLTPHQGRPPDYFYVALGGVERLTEQFRVADYMAFYRALKARFEAAVADVSAGGRAVDYPPSMSSPDPVEHCGVCRWEVACKRWWRETDHLSLVAGISRNQRRGLVEEARVDTRRGLAVLPLPVPKLTRANRESLTRVREQARLQVAGEDAGKVLHELLPPDAAGDGAPLPGRGLAALPRPSPGDLFFDIEGDPFAFDEGLEYLWGVIEPGVTDEQGRPIYHPEWALTKAAEKAAFETFIDFVVARRALDNGLHVYHYGSYERGRVARMSTRHATRELEVDELLRAGVFVDLYSAFRQAVRASVESYSIKRLEPLYGFVREVDLREAGDSIVEFERYLEEGGSDPTILPKIADYNRDDCLSAWRLRDWLEARRPEAEDMFGMALPRPDSKESAPKADQAAARAEVAEVSAALIAGTPAAVEPRSAEDAARQLLADLLDWHWREEKSTWWRFYDLMRRSDAELLEEREPIAGLELAEIVPPGPRQSNARYRYRFPPQENEVDVGSPVHDPVLLEADGGHRIGIVDEIDQAAGMLVIGRKPGIAHHPTALVPMRSFSGDTHRRALLEIARWVAQNGLRGDGPHRAARDLLLRASPRVGQAGGGSLPSEDSGAELVGATETGGDAAKRLVLALDQTTLPIQGPPGSGKSTIGAQMILALVDAGKRVGITANSHKVIGNLLKKVLEASARRDQPVRSVQLGKPEQVLSHELNSPAKDGADIRAKLEAGEALIAAGTSWLWTAPDMRDAVDVLFVDEAGQLSLANALAVSVGARNLVLLGDPQQLDQPTQGAHPQGAEKSALQHILREAQTIDPRRGIFLEHTWRLHPDITAMTSELFYADRLESHAGLERQRVETPFTTDGLFAGAQLLHGSGLRFVSVDHVGNTSRSVEEAELVAQIARDLAEQGTVWIDAKGVRRPLGWSDVLIVAPYNDQVAAIRERLPEEGKQRAGTVDKFQGQEAAVAIYSMTTSSPDEAPHGLDFLYSLNRLNVATSRARCLAVVVASPQLLCPQPRTPRQLRLANALCRFVELAETLALAPGGAR